MSTETQNASVRPFIVRPPPKPRSVWQLPLINAIPRREKHAAGQRRVHRLVRTRLLIRLAPRLLNRDAAAAYCGVSITHFFAHIVTRVPPILIGRKRVWDVKAIDRWIDQQTGDGEISMSPEKWLERLDGDPHSRR